MATTIKSVAWRDLFEIVSRSGHAYANPFRKVKVTARFTSPTGRRVRVPGFYDGAGVWRVRAALDEVGMWRYETEFSDGRMDRQTGFVECIASGNKGFLYPHPDNPFAFAYENGMPFFHMGDTSYNLVLLDRETQRLPYLEARKAQGFGLIRFMPFHDPERTWPFGGTRRDPDYDRFNVAHFQRVDGIMQDLLAQDMVAEMIVEQFYNGVMRRPDLWTPERERAWWDYVVARYSAYSNLAYWTLANEYECYPDGAYRFDYPDDVEWARRTARYVQQIDPYHHPVAVHPESSDPMVGRLFGSEAAFAIIMRQTRGERRKAGGYYDGTGAGIENRVLQDRRYGKPVVVAEFGYEYNGYTARGVNVSTDLLRRQAWRIVMGGGHFSAGFRSTVYNFPEEIEFDVTNNGGQAAEQLSYLRDFLVAGAYWRLHPVPSRVAPPHLCLADERREYVCFLPEPIPLRLDLKGVYGHFSVTWLNPITGDQIAGQDCEGGSPVELESPFVPEAAVRLQVRK